MKEQALISVIIPSFNRKKRLEKTLVSVLEQTYNTLEIIVVDDGSTDGTEEFMLDFIEKNKTAKSIFYIKQQNRGAANARNNGFRHSHGEFVVFFDSDDVMLPQRIEKRCGEPSIHHEVYVECWHQRLYDQFIIDYQ